MDNEEVLGHVRRITWGKKFVTVKDNKLDKYFIIRLLKPSELFKSDCFYEQELHKCIRTGVMSEKELLIQAARRGVWSDAQEERVHTLQRGIANLKESIHPQTGIFRNNKIKHKTIQLKIYKYEYELKNLLKIKNSILEPSAENRANYLKFKYMASLFTETLEEKMLWKGVNNIKYADTPLVYNLVEAYYTQNIFTQAQIREIARNGIWRNIWNTAVKESSLFGIQSSEYNDEQSALAYWTHVYEAVEQHLERPSRDVIENDEALDKWLKEEDEKIEKERRKKQFNLDKKKGNEIFIFADTPEKIETIQSMNSEAQRKKIAHEQKIIEEKGSISEFDLRKRDILLDARKKHYEKEKAAGRKRRYL